MANLTKAQFVNELKKLQGHTIKSVARQAEYTISNVSDDLIEGTNENGTSFKIKVDKLFRSYYKGTNTRDGLRKDKCVCRECYLSPALAILKILYEI